MSEALTTNKIFHLESYGLIHNVRCRFKCCHRIVHAAILLVHPKVLYGCKQILGHGALHLPVTIAWTQFTQFSLQNTYSLVVDSKSLPINHFSLFSPYSAIIALWRCVLCQFDVPCASIEYYLYSILACKISNSTSTFFFVRFVSLSLHRHRIAQYALHHRRDIKHWMLAVMYAVQHGLHFNNWIEYSIRSCLSYASHTIHI